MAKIIKEVRGNVGQIHPMRQVGEKNSSVIDFSIASTERVRNAAGDGWEDGETIWTNCTAWNRAAENVNKTWKPGDQVFVKGEVKLNTYKSKETGEMVSREVLTVEFLGHDETFFPATQDRPAKGSSNGGNNNARSNSAPRQSAPAQTQPQNEAPVQKSAPVEKKEAPKNDPDDFNFDFNFGEDAF